MPAYVPNSYREYVSNGTTTTVVVPFPYLRRAHVGIYRNLDISSGEYSTKLVDGIDYTWVNDTTITLTPALALGQVYTIRRATPGVTPLVVWSDASTLTARDLNLADTQLFYFTQEQLDVNADPDSRYTTKAETDQNSATIVNALAGKPGFAEIWTRPQADTRYLYFAQLGIGFVTRTVESKLRDVVSVKDFGATGNGATDDTAAIQAAIAAHPQVYFPPGTYAVTTINFNCIGARYSGTPSFKGIAATATAAVIEITHRAITFESLAVDQNFNSNYTAAIKWHSPSAGQPAQYIKIKELSINNCIIGILFGQLFGTAVVDAPQSENSITHMNTRGCQIPIYMRQPNGFLYIGESTISSIRNEWETANPGVYSHANSRIVVSYNGVLSISNSEVVKTDTQLGLGLELLGGTTNLSNVFIECASRNLDITLGNLNIVNSLLYFSNASDSFWRIAQAATGTAFVSNTTFLRAEGAANSSRGFIEHEGNTAYRLMGSNCRAINFLNSAFIISAQSRPNLIPRYFDLQNFSCQDGDAARADIKIASNQTGRSLLIAKNVDLSGDTTDGWYHTLNFGGGTTFGVVVDGPSLGAKDKTLASSLELNSTGESYYRSIDVTSAATAKSTGLTVTPGQTLLVTCWLKRISGTNARVGLATVTSGGTVSYLDLVSSTTDLPSGTWTYLQTVCQVPAGVKYVGIEMRNTVSVSRLAGADLAILN